MKYTKEQAEKNLQLIWPDIQIISEYTGADNKVIFKCKKCGHEWQTTIGAVKQSKHGCPKCGLHEAYKNKTIKHIKEKLSNKFEFIEYIDPMHIKVKCKDCGNIRITCTSNLLKYGCKICKMKKVHDLQTLSQEQFIQKAKEVHGETYDYSQVKYINYHTKVAIICKQHGIFMQSPAKHLAGQGCPKCIGKNQTIEEFIQKAQQIHGDYYNYDEVNFINMKTPVTLICPKHGKFNILPSAHINGRCGCHECSESQGEKLINSILTNLKLNFTREYSIINPYSDNHNFRVDFYLTFKDQHYIIEYNGKQHYEIIPFMGGELGFKIRQERDKHLRLYCKENNIKLLEIKYNNDKNIQEQIEQFLSIVPSNQVTDQIITEQKR